MSMHAHAFRCHVFKIFFINVDSGSCLFKKKHLPKDEDLLLEIIFAIFGVIAEGHLDYDTL